MGKGEQTRKTILDAALVHASTHGLEGLSIGGLATEVGMSKSGLFAHFDSKEQLQRAVLEHARERFIASVVAPALREPRGEPRLRALFQGWMRWEREVLPGGCPFHTAASEFDDRPGSVRDLLVDTQRDWADTLTQVFASGAASGQFRADLDVPLATFELVGIFIAYNRYHRLLEDRASDRLARASFDSLVARCRAKP